jgi:hypothetical protein
MTPIQSLRAQLPDNSYYEFVHDLCRALPDPPDDTPQALALRNESAITVVAALLPTNLAEAKLAALHVAATDHALACYHRAEQPEAHALGQQKCLALAASLTRQAGSTLRLLQRTQAIRHKTEANQQASNRAAWTEHCALNLMAEVLQQSSPWRLREAAEPDSTQDDGASPQGTEPAEPKAPSPCGSGLAEGAEPARMPDDGASHHGGEAGQEPAESHPPSPCARGLGEGAEPGRAQRKFPSGSAGQEPAESKTPAPCGSGLGEGAEPGRTQREIPSRSAGQEPAESEAPSPCGRRLGS